MYSSSNAIAIGMVAILKMGAILDFEWAGIKKYILYIICAKYKTCITNWNQNIAKTTYKDGHPGFS